MGRGTWGLQSMGSQKSRTRLKRLSTDTCRQEMTAFASYVWVTKKEKKKTKNHQTQTKSKQRKVRTKQVTEKTKLKKKKSEKPRSQV